MSAQQIIGTSGGRMMGQMNGQTNRRTPDRYIDTAPHTGDSGRSINRSSRPTKGLSDEEKMQHRQIFYSITDRGAEYCDDRVCLYACLSVRESISGTTRPIFTKFLRSLRMAVTRSLNIHDIAFAHNVLAYNSDTKMTCGSTGGGVCNLRSMTALFEEVG